MKKLSTCFACMLLSACFALAQTGKTGTLKVQAARLKTFFEQHQTEKAYLHFDKPYYAAGDTVYFKAYVTAGEKNALSTLSGVLYVDLINPQNKIVDALKLKISDGLANGDFALADSLLAGNYRIRAYTRLMQNYGSESFFDKTIPLASMASAKVTKGTSQSKKTAIASPQPDIQFFAEGGELVAGVPSKIAFKAIMPGGNGVNVTGTVFDNNNKPVASFASSRLGMGMFQLTPAEGQTYHAEVSFANASKTNINLPTARPDGVAIAVLDSGSKISVHINPSKLFYEQNKNQPLGLFIYSGGKLTTVSDVMDGPDMRIDIQKSGLRSGIAQITLLSAKGEPLCERLVFIDKDDKLALDLSTDKKQYKLREQVKVNLHLDAADFDATAHFSVAVIDRSKVDIDENQEENILTYLLLTSCLKGNIEEPGYYFTHTDAKKRAELDLVMLTHGYRRFTWKNIVNDDLPPLAILPEKALSINGLAKSMGGKPLNNGLITLIPSRGGALLRENTDAAGLFGFKNLAFYDTTRFILNAVNNKGGNNTMLTYKPDGFAPILPALYASNDTSKAAIIHAYLLASQKQHTEYLKYYGNATQLQEVKIRGVKQANYRTASLAGAGNADAVIHGSDLPIGGMLATLLAGRVGGLYFADADKPNGGVPKLQIGFSSTMAVIVDGLQRVPLPGEQVGINDIAPGDVETIEVLKSTKGAIYGVSGGNGVLIITTKQGAGTAAKDIVSHGVLPVTVTGYYKAREFYAPRYDKLNDHTRADLRSTIYWLPELATDKNGNASFNFYNADGVGKYQVIVEGISNDGTAGVVKLTYEVKE